ncbi:preprotein translocase subunit SecE [Rickettsia akari str. Hartford]|uniref:Protein translocase subunit SecE n=1 Tax=Rickettsia akari (strain Hartford) TaxID=293614 RepID=A8GMA1_RICAH|nr:preprotein translocase subunit SecE [Rickettsia akari]ABV74526.1 preprotein translocase subunit SecE [Rickettsia akari str. Hartford]
MFKEYKIYKLCEQVKQEIYKVVWPTKKELVASTLVVVAAVFIFSLICLVLDYSIHNIMQLLLNIGKLV